MTDKKQYNYIYNNDGTEMIEYNNGHYIMDMDDATELLNEQYQRIKQLEKELSESKKDPFKFNFTEHYDEINANTLDLKDKHTMIKIDGDMIHITVIQPNHEPYTFKYMITGIIFDEKREGVHSRRNW